MSTTKRTDAFALGSRHKYAASVDTNASAMAESTISLGQIGKFPEPPASIPESPTTSTFSAATSRQLSIPFRPQVPLHLHSRKLPSPNSIPLVHPSNLSYSFVQPDSISKTSTVVSAHDWHEGASTIDVDMGNEQLSLPTTFITSLLQEHKFKRASSTSLTLSGISEDTRLYKPPGRFDTFASTSVTHSATPSVPVTRAYNSEISSSPNRTLAEETSAARTQSFTSSNSFKSNDGLLEKSFSGPYCPKPNDPYLPSQVPTTSTQSFSKSRSRLDSSVSTRSARSFLSRISQRLALRHIYETKPLPPIPNMHLTRQPYHEVCSTPPNLIKRTPTLQNTFENGQRPRKIEGNLGALTNFNEHIDTHTRLPWFRKPMSNLRRVVFLVLLALLIIGLVVGLVFGLRKHRQFSCPEGKIGTRCNINANCVCTSTTQCNGLAQAVIELLPSVNSVFRANYTAALAYSSFWLMGGGSQGNNCAAQGTILDVGGNIDPTNFANRTRWAQTALLWNALKTQDSVATLQLQKFVQSLPWSSLQGTDGPVDDAEATSFSITVSGYAFNFASQTVTQPPATFATLGQPSDALAQKLGPSAVAVLDRMYTYAQASSSQQQIALQKYWTSVLLQRADTLPIFKAAITNSPIMLPFNATSKDIRDLYPVTSTPPSFPPPLYCIPDLDSSFQQQAGSYETTVFGLPNLSVGNQTGFNSSCYKDHPTYGVLNVLQLRLPFRDDVPSVAQYAAVLSRDSNSRIVFSVGKGFSGMFGGSITLSPSQLDTRQYGTVNSLDHVILQYLVSISDFNVVNALIEFVLDSRTATQAVPPERSSALYQALQALPTLEVAVWGDVTISDLSSIVSPFVDNSGSLFFGSENGSTLRNWTITTAHSSIVWTQNATSPLVLRDNSLGDNPITTTWNSVSLALSRQTTVGLVNITGPLMESGSFSP